MPAAKRYKMERTMKKKRLLICGILIIAALIGTIYLIKSDSFNRKSNYLKYDEDGILLIYKQSPAGETNIYESYVTTIILYNDGKVELIGTFTNGHQIMEEFNISEIHVKSLQNTIARVNFMELEEDVSTDSSDGSYYYITVNTKTKTHKSGGLNPDNNRYLELKKNIEDVIPTQVNNEFNKKINTYINCTREDTSGTS